MTEFLLNVARVLLFTFAIVSWALTVFGVEDLVDSGEWSGPEWAVFASCFSAAVLSSAGFFTLIEYV